MAWDRNLVPSLYCVQLNVILIDLFCFLLNILLGYSLSDNLMHYKKQDVPSAFNTSSNFVTLKKSRSRQYHIETMRDADYTDNPALLTNAPAQAKSILHSLEQATRGIK